MTDIPKIIGTTKYIKNRRTSIDIIFIQIPTRIISEIFNSPEPNTIALGGVATGNMKAQDAAIAVAHISRMGFMSMASARAAIIGSIIDVVAELDVISVKKFINATMIRSIIATCVPLRYIKLFPIQSERPVLAKLAARVSPPPKSKIISQGIFIISSHVSNLAEFFEDGKINSITAEHKAIIVSKLFILIPIKSKI